VLLQQFAPAAAAFLEREPAQRTDESNGIDGLHRRIEPALLGQIADGMRHVVRAIRAEHAAIALVGIDNAQQHAQCRRLARAVGAENAVNRAFGDGEVDAVDSREAVETLDEPACLDGQGTRGG